jgi:IS5 family transposase
MACFVFLTTENEGPAQRLLVMAEGESAPGGPRGASKRRDRSQHAHEQGSVRQAKRNTLLTRHPCSPESVRIRKERIRGCDKNPEGCA